MTWGNRASTGRKCGWTKDPRYGFRSNRAQNSEPTLREVESKKNIEAMAFRAQALAEKQAKVEAAMARAGDVLASGGGVVVKVADGYAMCAPPTEVGSPVLLSKMSVIEGESLSFIDATLESGAVGIYLGTDRIDVERYVLGRNRMMRVLAHKFIFGTQVVHFMSEVLGYLEVIS